MKTKRLSDLEQIAELTGGENLLVEADGAAKRIPASRVGKVKTVNGNAPDENGNVEIEFPEIPEDKVQTVNGIEPDAEGNVQLPEAPEPTWAGLPDKPFEELIEKSYYVNQTYFRDDATLSEIKDLYLNETRQYVIVSVNGVEYKDPPMQTGKIGYDIYLCFGNPYLLNDNEGGFVDNGLPYCLYRKTAASSTEMKMYGNPDVVGQDGYYSIYKCVHVGTKTIEDKYIPDTIARKTDIPETPEIPEHTWESLPDKPFGETVNREFVLESTAIDTLGSLKSDGLLNYYNFKAVAYNSTSPLAVGKEYIIDCDGSLHAFVCSSHWIEGSTYEWIGAVSSTSYPSYPKINSENPVGFAYVNGEFRVYLYNTDIQNVSLYSEDKNVVHLSEKFIPESILRKGKLRKIFEKGDAVLQNPSISADMEGNPLSLKGFIITVCYGTVSGSGSFSAKFTTEKAGTIDWGHTVGLSSNQSYNIHLWPVFGHYLPFQTAWANGLDKHASAQINTNRFLSYEIESMGAITGIEIDTSGLADGEFLADTTFEVWGIE